MKQQELCDIDHSERIAYLNKKLNKQTKLKKDKPKYGWCVYGLINKRVGKVISWSPKTVEIMYTQHQHYPTELWENHVAYVECFKTVRDALACYLSQNRTKCGCDLFEWAASDFDEIKRYIKRRGKQIQQDLEKDNKTQPCRHGKQRRK
jgi:hypothetical protein